MARRQQSIVSFDPISSKKKLGIIGRMLITRWGSGKSVKKDQPFGHYMFCGPQGSGKSASALWYAEKLAKKYKRKGYKVRLFSNIGVGKEVKKEDIFSTIDAFDPYAKEVRIVLLDEIHTYFPKDAVSKETKQIRDDLIAIFSQLRKRNTFILSTAQIYGRLDKGLREQCLYMIDCKVSTNKKLINEFIPQHDIMVDDLGRWAGNPKYIYRHGLSKLRYDTKKIIRE